MAIAPMTYSIDVNQLIDSQGVNEKYFEEILPANSSRTSNIMAYTVQDCRKHKLLLSLPQIEKLDRSIHAVKELTTERVDLKALTELANYESKNLEKSWNFENFLIPPLLNNDSFICDWLTRVESQFDPQTPQKIKEADLKHSKENLQRGRIFTALLPGLQTVELFQN